MTIAFGSEERPLFGFHHAPPADVPARAVGVVLCNPLGYEVMCAHRTYRHVAERLAAAGFHALRFDYDGTGDSAGSADDPDRVRAWLASIDHAVAALAARAPVRSVALFGVRLGATLAAVAATGPRTGSDSERAAPIESLVLWAPATSGKAYVRELRAFRMMQEARGPLATPHADGTEDIAGFRFAGATIADVSKLDLLTRTELHAKHVLVVPRDDLPGGEARLVQHFARLGAEAELRPEPGYVGMMRDAQDTIVPFATIDSMVSWLAERSPVAPPDAQTSPSPQPATEAVLDVGAVRERAVRFGEGDRLFGILGARREATQVAGKRPGVLLLNVGANHHIGPNRMYVTLGRELAEQGYDVLRFDVAGLGDSPNAPGAKENRLYSKDSVGDVKDAMAFLERERGLDRFVLVGLCSGAYLAFHTCVEDARVVGQVLLNPQTFEWKEGDSLELSIRKSFMSTGYYARALLDHRVWARAIRGELNVRGVAGVLRERLELRTRSAVEHATALVRGELEPQTEIERAFHAMTGRGVESLLVFSFNDGGIDLIEKHLGHGASKMRGQRGFRYEIVDGADHTFTPIASQEKLHAILTRWVTERFP